MEFSAVPGMAGNVLLRVKHTEPRKDDDNDDDVTWRGIEANLGELRNAVKLLEEAEYFATTGNFSVSYERYRSALGIVVGNYCLSFDPYQEALHPNLQAYRLEQPLQLNLLRRTDRHDSMV